MADDPAHGDDVEENLPPPPAVEVVDEILPAAQPDQPQGGAGRIPIVDTLESALDLPPNWETGPLPAIPGGVANSVPPPPPSLGSVSGRISSYTPDLQPWRTGVEGLSGVDLAGGLLKDL